MYERFTDRARKVMQLANQEAQRFNHEYIGTEHVLLGLIKEGSGVAANVLKNMDVDIRKVRLEVERLIAVAPEATAMGKLPLTPRAKKIIEWSLVESKELGHNYVGTEHILLGILREQEGIGPSVLRNLGLAIDAVRKEVLSLVGSGDSDADFGPLDLEEVRLHLAAVRQGNIPPDKLDRMYLEKLRAELTRITSSLNESDLDASS